MSLKIATDSLRSLPPGASYTGRQGQASVHVSRGTGSWTGDESPGTEYIYIDATCDSLQLLCERYERTIKMLHEESGERGGSIAVEQQHTKRSTEVTEKPPNAIVTALKWYFYGFVSGMLILFLLLWNSNIRNIFKK